ncbi:hypothetical protein ABT040_35895 [Streptomyces sp. NPDC002688]|uniref:hypothetical protein n=1 Tax=Streptomyces sp. NPDC002688 TaxID=3154423 RepID=UPI00331B03D1
MQHIDESFRSQRCDGVADGGAGDLVALDELGLGGQRAPGANSPFRIASRIAAATCWSRAPGRWISVIEIAIVGEPKGIEEGQILKISGLTAFAWVVGTQGIAVD